MRNFLLAAVALELKPGLGRYRLSLRPVHLISSNLVKQVTIRNFNEAAVRADHASHATNLAALCAHSTSTKCQRRVKNHRKNDQRKHVCRDYKQYRSLIATKHSQSAVGFKCIEQLRPLLHPSDVAIDIYSPTQQDPELGQVKFTPECNVVKLASRYIAERNHYQYKISSRPCLLAYSPIQHLNAAEETLPHAATLFRRAQNSAEIAFNSGAACAYIYWAKRQFVTENQACKHLQHHQKPQSKLARLQSAGTCSLASLRTKSHA